MMTSVETCEKRDFAIDERNKYDIVNRMCGRREVECAKGISERGLV